MELLGAFLEYASVSDDREILKTAVTLRSVTRGLRDDVHATLINDKCEAATRDLRSAWTTDDAQAAIDRGADVNDSESIHNACYQGFMDLLIAHPDLVTVDVEDVDDKTPLHHACYHDNLELMATLLDANANPNQPMPCGCTVLHHAVRDGRRSVAIVLLEYGADVQKPNEDKDTPLHVAAEMDDVELMEMMLIDGNEMRPIDFTLTNGQDQTYLHMAVGSENMVEILLEAGAVPDERAMRYAAMCGELLCFDLMMEQWPSDKDIDVSAMSRAARNAGHPDVANAILEWDDED
jgi:ankyrin repeat protein